MLCIQHCHKKQDRSRQFYFGKRREASPNSWSLSCYTFLVVGGMYLRHTRCSSFPFLFHFLQPNPPHIVFQCYPLDQGYVCFSVEKKKSAVSKQKKYLQIKCFRLFITATFGGTEGEDALLFCPLHFPSGLRRSVL